MNTINGEELLVTDYILNISVRTTQDLYEDLKYQSDSALHLHPIVTYIRQSIDSKSLIAEV